MKLHILGCSSVYPSGGRATSSYVLETASGGLLVDCGHEAASKLVESHALSDLNAVVISHMHPDHFYGLFSLCNRLLATRSRRLPLYLPPGGAAVMGNMAETMGFEYDAVRACFDSSEYDPARPLLVNGLTIRMRRTRHPVNTYAMRFGESSGGNHLVFTSDTGWFDELVEFCAGAHLLMVEATEWPPPPASETAERWHLTPQEAGRLIEEARPERALITHYDAQHSQAVLSAARGASSNRHILLAGEHEEHVV